MLEEVDRKSQKLFPVFKLTENLTEKFTPLKEALFGTQPILQKNASFLALKSIKLTFFSTTLQILQMTDNLADKIS